MARRRRRDPRRQTVTGSDDYGIKLRFEQGESGVVRTCFCCGQSYETPLVWVFVYTHTPSAGWQKLGDICGICFRNGAPAIREGFMSHARWFAAQAEASIVCPSWDEWVKREGEEEKTSLATWLARQGRTAIEAGAGIH